MKNFFAKIWNDPVWSKVISTLIVGLPAAILYFNFRNFLTSLLVASIIINILFSVDKLKAQPKKHDSKDEGLFIKINTLFDLKAMDSFTDDLSNGYVRIEDKDKIYKLMEISRYDKFLNSSIQSKLTKFIEVLKDFLEFFGSEFSKEDEEIKIHRYRDIPEGYIKCDENFKKAQNFANQIYSEYEKLNDLFRKKYPETYIWQEVRHTPIKLPSVEGK